MPETVKIAPNNVIISRGNNFTDRSRMLSGISIWQLFIILLIVIVLFGTSRLKDLGTDLGEAIKSFRKSVHDLETNEAVSTLPNQHAANSTENKSVDKP